MPITCTGSPSAEESSSWSEVTMAQEKSRAMFSTAERPDRSSVFVISRQIASRRFAITASRTGSSSRGTRSPTPSCSRR